MNPWGDRKTTAAHHWERSDANTKKARRANAGPFVMTTPPRRYIVDGNHVTMAGKAIRMMILITEEAKNGQHPL